MRIYEFLSRIAKQGETFTFEDAYRITRIDRAYLRKLLYRLEHRGVIKRIGRAKTL